MNTKTKTYHSTKPFLLENGATLPSLEIAYTTYGKLNSDHSNVVWVCHALTANSEVFEWWPGFFGEGHFFNPEEYFIICANNLGSCYGTTGPLTFNPDFNNAYYSLFPDITIRDMVNAHELLREHIGIERIHTVIGGSQGGQQVLEWAIHKPSLFENVIVVATNAKHSPWGIAFNEAQRLAIKADRTYYSNSPTGGAKGLKAARTIALLSYRNYTTYSGTQNEEDNEKVNNFKASSYQNYQGEKLVKRFNAYSYITLSQAMDSQNVGRGRESVETALSTIRANTLVIGVSSDILFPVEEQRFIAKFIPGAVYTQIDSFYGHDGFLIEAEQLTEKVKIFYNGIYQSNPTTIGTNATA
jgi:homoserine O-acetyltransferase/O-succinyltransferase